MNAGELCRRPALFVYRDTPLVDAAALMRKEHVGSLVVAEDAFGAPRPTGLITDRDIALQVVAKNVDASRLTAGDIASPELITVSEADPATEVLRVMRERGVRRVPVLARGGQLAGIITLDDLLDQLASELQSLAHTLGRERVREIRERR